MQQSEVVSMNSVEGDFWGRFKATVDFGYSLTKANETKQLTLTTTSSYLAEKLSGVRQPEPFFGTWSQDRPLPGETRSTPAIGDSWPIAGTRWPWRIFSQATSFNWTSGPLLAAAPAISSSRTTAGILARGGRGLDPGDFPGSGEPHLEKRRRVWRS